MTPGMAFILWIAAVILAVLGVVQLLQGQIILGIVLLVAACLVGPGGYSIFGTVKSGSAVLTKVAAGGVSGGSADGAPATPINITSVTVK